MSFLNQILEPPSYGWARDEKLYVPTHREIFAEFRSGINIFKSKKNWLQLFSWIATAWLAVPFFVFVFKYFRWDYTIIGLVYAMVVLGSFGTFWYHRYGTHRAFRFKNQFWIQVLRNLTIRIIPEEVYIISHHVHHADSEKPGDPYNVYGGWLYCFLADVNHQKIAQNLNPAEYQQLTRFLSDTGVKINTYEQYQKWGSLCHPFRTVCHFVLNWIFWYGAFYMIGGHAFATGMFGMSVVWAVGVRTFNFDGHGRGTDRRRKGIDFHWEDISVNQVWPGYVAGEWHNNHHLFPSGARSGFLPYQVDLPWYFVKFLHTVGIVTDYKDYMEVFHKRFYQPYLKSLTQPTPVPMTTEVAQPAAAIVDVIEPVQTAN